MHMKNEIGDLKAKAKKGTQEHKALFWRYHSTKVVINSLFGATGFFRSRHYKFEVCQNVQSVEREILPETIAIVQRMGYEVVLADTDSVGFVIGSLEEAEEVCAKVNVENNRWNHEKFNTIESEKYELELDKYYSSLMLIAKKKYAGIVVYESGDCMYVYKRGLESVRSDWCQAVREFQDKLLFKLLTKKDWKSYIKETKTAFFAGKLDEQMIVSKTLKKPIDQYETATPHVRAASMLADMGHPVRIGDKVWYIKTGDEKTSVIPVIPGQPIILKKSQREFLWKKQFESIIERFSISKNKTLSDFFG
jgi:DNA polymerase-2